MVGEGPSASLMMSTLHVGDSEKSPTTRCERLAAAAEAMPGMLRATDPIDAGSENPRVGGSNPPLGTIPISFQFINKDLG